AQDPLQQPNVGREAAGELAGAAVGEEARWHLEEAREDFAAEPGYGPLTGGAEQICLDVIENGLDREEPEQAERYAAEQRPAAIDERGVEEALDDERKREPDSRTADEREPGQGECGAMRPHARPEADETPRRTRRRVSGPDGRRGAGRRRHRGVRG